MTDEFTIKDSGERASFAGGMTRDTSTGKIDYTSVRFGPMYKRWAAHTTKGRVKYPDPEPGVPNWTLAEGAEELARFKESACRHFEDWLDGKRDEDHAAGVYFNINGFEYVRDKLELRDSIVLGHRVESVGAPRLDNGNPCGYLSRTVGKDDEVRYLAPCRYRDGHRGPHES